MKAERGGAAGREKNIYSVIFWECVSCGAVSSLPCSSQRPIGVKVDVVDSFTVALLMENLLLNLQIPQTPRAVIAAETHKFRKIKITFWFIEHQDQWVWGVYQVVPRNLPEGCQDTRDTRSLCPSISATGSSLWQPERGEGLKTTDGRSHKSQEVTINIIDLMILMSPFLKPIPLRSPSSLFTCHILTTPSSPTSPDSKASPTHQRHMRPGWRPIGPERCQPVDGRQLLPRWCCVLRPITGAKAEAERRRSLGYQRYSEWHIVCRIDCTILKGEFTFTPINVGNIRVSDIIVWSSAHLWEYEWGCSRGQTTAYTDRSCRAKVSASALASIITQAHHLTCKHMVSCRQINANVVNANLATLQVLWLPVLAFPTQRAN